MNAQELYEELKDAADWFGVGFHGMDKIKVEVVGGKIILSAGGRHSIVIAPEKAVEVRSHISKYIPGLE